MDIFFIFHPLIEQIDDLFPFIL
ncbi:hypothetical protein D041_4062A, partial [Vibrio parahaemolyticus EKP-008]